MTGAARARRRHGFVAVGTAAWVLAGCAPGSEVGEDDGAEQSSGAGASGAPGSGGTGSGSGAGGGGTGAQASGGGAATGGSGNAGPCGGKSCQPGQDCVNEVCTFPCDGVTVPGDYATIQSAVTALQKVGAIICVQPGSYPEDVTVDLGGEELVLRGTSADQVAIEGKLLVKGATVEAPGLVVEGVTITEALQTIAAQLIRVRASRLQAPEGPALIIGNYYSQVEVDGCDISGAGAAVDVFTPGATAPDWVYARILNSYIRGGTHGVSIYSSFHETRVILEGNTIRGGTRGIQTQGDGDVPLELSNNIITETEIGLDLKSTEGLEHANNAFFANVTNYAGAALPGPGYVIADCLLDDSVEPPSLSAGSPCRDAGTTDVESTHDFYGIPRGAAPDIGAIEAQP